MALPLELTSPTFNHTRFEAFQQLPLVEVWRQKYFGTPSAEGLAADTGDPDGDGDPNLAEFCFGTDPTDAASANALLTNFVADGGTNYLSITFPRRKNCDIGFVVEVVPEISGVTRWTNRVVQVGPPVSRNAEFEQVTFHDTVPAATASARFMSVRLQQP
jgi:hypothetical protein